VGGILYSFEEVCSHWPHKLTWRAFFCTIVAAFTFTAVMNTDLGSGLSPGGSVVRDSLVLNIASTDGMHTWRYADFAWAAILGVLGGVLGAGYTAAIVRLAAARKRWVGTPRRRVLEVLLLSVLFFVVAFCLPLAYPCTPCAADMACGGGASSDAAAAPGRYLRESAAPPASAPTAESEVESRWSALFYEHVAVSGAAGRAERPHARRRLSGGTIYVIRWHCPERQYSEMATLFQSGQEGLIKFLLQLGSDRNEAIAIPALGWFLLTYYLLAVAIFGISVPSGNFVPAMTIGAVMGRLVGESVDNQTNYGGEDFDAGKFALLGAAAMLSGVTRMTLALSVLLVEVTKDIDAMLYIMTTLAVAKMVGDLLSPSFDDAMIHAARLPYLEEEPPHEFELLTVRDVMSSLVVVLKEVESVGDLWAVLKRTRHNGFPVIDVGRQGQCTFFAGVVLRRQLLLLLKHRVWELQERGEPLSRRARLELLDATRAPLSSLRVASYDLSEDDKRQVHGSSSPSPSPPSPDHRAPTFGH
jgi:chloride channel 7